jgi:hypothetical protein
MYGMGIVSFVFLMYALALKNFDLLPEEAVVQENKLEEK